MVTAIEKFTLSFLAETTAALRAYERRAVGRDVVGGSTRPEDEEIALDRVAFPILKGKLEDSGWRMRVFGEHQDLHPENFQYTACLDDFDGTSIAKRGFPHMHYVAIGIFDKNNKPVCAGVSETMAERVYITREEGSFVHFLDTGEEKRLVPSKRKQLDGSSTVGSYIMKPKRAMGFTKKFEPFLKSLDPKTLIYPNGGPALFPYVAGGMIDMYLIESEPRLEIDSGFFLAEKENCRVTQINPDWSTEPYRFVPGKQEERIMLIVTPNKELEDVAVGLLKDAAKVS